MLVTILGKRWKLRFVSRLKALGECDPPDKKGKEIRIRASLKGEMLLDTLLHELLHSGNWHLDEEFVERFCTDAARVLTKLGYRREE